MPVRRVIQGAKVSLSGKCRGTGWKSLPAHEQGIEFGHSQLCPCRAAVVALVGAFGFFHVAQQGVHFRYGQAAVGADGMVAGDGGEPFVSFFQCDAGCAVFVQVFQ